MRIMAYTFHVDHIIPQSLGGTNDLSNLALACQPCNAAKHDTIRAYDPQTGQSVPLFNPRTQRWDDHFKWSKSFLYVRGRTPIGRATVRGLKMNSNLQRQARPYWHSAGLIP
jgi:hypothetical protein